MDNDDNYNRAVCRMSTKSRKKQTANCNLIVPVEFMLEYIALFDFITDVIIARQLFHSRNIGWAVVTSTSILVPFAVKGL